MPVLLDPDRCPQSEEQRLVDAASEMLASDRRAILKQEREDTGAPKGFSTSTLGTKDYESSRASSKLSTGFNLKDVAEVLIEEGYDPIVEMVQTMKNNAGIEPEVRLRFCNELAKYVHAQKKAVELSGKLELTDAQADKRLAELQRRAAEIAALTGEDMI